MISLVNSINLLGLGQCSTLVLCFSRQRDTLVLVYLRPEKLKTEMFELCWPIALLNADGVARLEPVCNWFQYLHLASIEDESVSCNYFVVCRYLQNSSM